MKINQVAIEQAIEWYMIGWDAFKRDMNNWLLITLLLILVVVGIAFTPILNWAFYLCLPIFLACGVFFARKSDLGSAPKLEQLLVVFGHREKRGQLIMLGISLLALVGLISLLLPKTSADPVFSYSLTEMAAMSEGMHVSSFPWQRVLVSLFIAIVCLILGMLFIFSPALVLFKRVSAMEALGYSFKACWQNRWTLLLFVGLCALLLFLAMLPLGLGLLVLIPVLFNAIYSAYVEIFGNVPMR